MRLSDLGFESKKEFVLWLKEIKKTVQETLEEEICISDIIMQYLEDVKQENEYYFQEYKYSSISEEWPGENEVMFEMTQQYGLEVFRCEKLLKYLKPKVLNIFI